MLNLEVNCSVSTLVPLYKKDTLRFLVRLAVVWLCSSPVRAQEVELHKVYFHPHEQLTGNYIEVKENNLPIKGTQVLYQSQDQTVWIGTENNGLISYTGNSIKHYRLDPKNKASLSSNRIEEIWEESPTVLWITTNDGIVKLDRLYGRFTRFAAKTRFVRRAADGALYTSVIGEGIFRIDTVHHRLINVQKPHVLNEKGVSYTDETMMGISKIETDKEGTLWAAGSTKTLSGLFHFEPETGYWMFHEPAAYAGRPDTNGVKKHKTGANTDKMKGVGFTLFIDDSNRIWCGTWGTGLFCYHKKSGQWQQYSFYRDGAKRMVNDNVVAATYELNKDELWLSSYHNGFIFNHEKGTAYNYTFLDGMGVTFHFGKQTAYTLLDHCGNRWIATSDGVFKGNIMHNLFSAADKRNKPLIQGKVITALYQLEPEHYLISANGPETEDAHLKTDIYEIRKGRIVRDFQANGFTNNATVRQFIPDGHGEFYVCGFLFYKLNLKKGSLQNILIKIAPEAGLSGKYIDSYNNFLWNDSILYTCRRTTAAAGLVRVNLKLKEAQIYKTTSIRLSPHFPQDNHVVRMTKDSYNRLWCGTAGGVDIFYPDKQIFEHYSPVEGDTTSLLGVQSPRVCETSDHTFYIASQSGVCATKAIPGTRATFTPIAYLD